MKVKLLNQILSALPEAATHREEYIDIFYTEAFTSLNVMPDKDNVRSNVLHPSMKVTFRRIHDFNGYDWDVINIENLKSKI